MKITRKDISDLEIALQNYKQMWSENKSLSGVPSNAAYIDMNIAMFEAIVNRMKRENT
jgi:hypothetical protein